MIGSWREVRPVATSAFVINTFRDSHLALPLVEQVRRLYPEAPIALISDGDNTPPLVRQVCDELSVVYVQGDRLKLRKTGTMWIKRWLNVLASFDCDYGIKLDADSWMWRSIASFPDAEVGGNIIPGRNEQPLVLGGARFMTRSAIHKILESNVLDDLKYTRATNYCYLWDANRLPGESKSGLIFCEDLALADIFQRLNLSLALWEDIYCMAEGTVPPTAISSSSITHPHRLPLGCGPLCDRARVIIAGLAIEGFTSENELAWLYDNAFGYAVEVGSLAGRSATVIGQKLQRMGGRLTCIDPWMNYVSSRGVPISSAETFRQFADNVDGIPTINWRRVTSQMAALGGARDVDFLFLDGDHNYTAIRRDLLAWLPRIRPNGIICGHDWSDRYPGVKQAVSEILPRFEVYESIWYIRL